MLTEVDCRNGTCPPVLKRRQLTDAGGLYPEVSPGSSKRWFWKFYPDGKESRLALGSYPEVTLKSARLARDVARRLRTGGTSPVQQRKADRLANSTSSATTFEAVAREFRSDIMRNRPCSGRLFDRDFHEVWPSRQYLAQEQPTQPVGDLLAHIPAPVRT
jgi:hypothetical protein